MYLFTYAGINDTSFHIRQINKPELTVEHSMKHIELFLHVSTRTLRSDFWKISLIPKR